MHNHESLALIKKKLPRAFPLFFGTIGKINSMQLEVIPKIIEGMNLVLMSPTASGKTEAVFAPFIEKILDVQKKGLKVLYITPTRALVNDMYERTHGLIRKAHLSIARKTGDHPTLDRNDVEDIIITTPESLDSMLTRYGHIFHTLRAIVLDELHLIDNTTRGDQLRILLRRLEKEYLKGQAQYAILSATIADPLALGLRYFDNPTVIKAGNPRPIELTLHENLKNAIAECKTKRLLKILIFCNARKTVEELMQELPSYWPKDKLFAHHGSLSKKEREETEKALKLNSWGICVSTMTLEIGVDIGDIDIAILYRPPHDFSSFLQRVGRACRRKDTIKTIGVYENDEDKNLFLLFEQLAQEGRILPSEYSPDVSVCVQQIFSLLYEKRQGIEINELIKLFENVFARETVLLIINHLQKLGFLATRRDRVFAETKLINLGNYGLIHSNISTAKEYNIINQASNALIGKLDFAPEFGQLILLKGAAWEVIQITSNSVYCKKSATHIDAKTYFAKKQTRGAFAQYLPKELQKE